MAQGDSAEYFDTMRTPVATGERGSDGWFGQNHTPEQLEGITESYLSDRRRSISPYDPNLMTGYMVGMAGIPSSIAQSSLPTGPLVCGSGPVPQPLPGHSPLFPVLASTGDATHLMESVSYGAPLSLRSRDSHGVDQLPATITPHAPEYGGMSSPVAIQAPASPLQPPAEYLLANENRHQDYYEIHQTDTPTPWCLTLIPRSKSNRNTEGIRRKSKSKSSKRPMADSERLAVKHNRKAGVCLRCKFSKEKCRAGIPCDRCRSLSRWSDICVLVKFEGKNVFDRELYHSRVTALLDNVRGWLSGPQHSQAKNDVVIEVCNGYAPRLRLKVEKFESKNDALLEHIIWRGTERPTYNRHPSTPYGLKSEPNLDDYLDQHVMYFLEEEETRIDLPLVSIYAATLKAAYAYSRSGKPLSSLVQKAIRIWIAQTFLFQNVWRLKGDNNLGMSPIHDLNGLVPLPRLINQQLDFYLEKKVASLEKEVLTELQRHIINHEKPSWFGIYLTIYVFLCSLEKDLWSLYTWENDADILKERTRELAIDNPESQKATVWPINDHPSELISKNRHLAHMLVCILRGMSKGNIPFQMDWGKKGTMEMVNEDSEVIDYMRNMSSQIAQYQPYLLERQKAQYSRNDARSYIAKFTSRLMTGSVAAIAEV